MIKWFILLQFTSFLAYADCRSFEEAFQFLELNEVEEISEHIMSTDYLARPVVENAPCRSTTPTMEEMRAYLDSQSSNQTRSRWVAGVRLTDSPEMLRLFKDIHEPDPRHAREPWKYAEGATITLPLPSNCQNVQCAMNRLYGEELGTQILYMHSKFGFNASHIGVGEGVPWSPESLDIALTMLEDFSHLLPADGRRFVNIPEDDYVATSWINVYNPWHTLPIDEKTTSLAHELGHVMSEEIVYSPEWLRLGGWTSSENIEGERVWHMQNPETAVLEYARTSPDEDFGETFFMYRYNGAALKRNFPAKYEYMRTQVFQNREYDTVTNCTEAVNR